MLQTRTVTFPIPFINTNYFVFHQYEGNTAMYSGVLKNEKTKNNCNIMLNDSSGALGYYYIVGFYK